MTKAPSYNAPKSTALHAELLRRARMWLPDWHAGEAKGDAGSAVLKIAARLESEVTQRLNKVSEKSFRGFLYWLGWRGQPGHAARVPIAFRMGSNAEPALVPPPIQLQAEAGGTSMIFEISTPLRVLPATLQAMIAAEPARDRFYGPFNGLSPWEAPKPAPDSWLTVVTPPDQATQLQLDPPAGLEPGIWIADTAGNRYQIQEAKDGLVTIWPKLGTDSAIAPASTRSEPMRFTRIAAFDPFDPAERDRQQHALYLGSTAGLDIKTKAVIAIDGDDVPIDWEWRFWGKDGEKEPDWVLLKEADKIPGHRHFLKESGSIELRKIGETESRWLRATPPAEVTDSTWVHKLNFTLNCVPGDDATLYQGYREPEAKELDLEGVANTAPVPLDQPFYPFGREPRLFDAFYLGAKQVFSKARATAIISIETGDAFSGPIVSVAYSASISFVFGIAGDRRLHAVALDEGRTPPTREFKIVDQPSSITGEAVRLEPVTRLGAAWFNFAVFLTVVGEGSVWRWQVPVADGVNPWASLGSPISDAKITDTVLVASSGALLIYALANGRIFKRDAIADSAWTLVGGSFREKQADNTWNTTDLSDDEASKPIEFARLVPVIRPDAPVGAPDEDDGFVVVTKKGQLAVRDGGDWTVVRTNASLKVYPLALRGNGRLTIFAADIVRAANDKHDEINQVVAIDATDPEDPDFDSLPQALIGDSFSYLPGGADVPMALYFGKEDAKPVTTYLWQPFGSKPPTSGPTMSEGNALKSGPVLHAGFYVIAESGGAIALAQVATDTVLQNAERLLAATVNTQDGWENEPYLLVDLTPGNPQARTMLKPDVVLAGTDTVFLFYEGIANNDREQQVTIYRTKSADEAGQWDKGTKELTLAAGDTDADVGTLLYIAWNGTANQRVAKIAVVWPATTTTPKRVTLVHGLPASAHGAVNYRNIDKRGDDQAAQMRLALRPAAPVAISTPLDQIIVQAGASRLGLERVVSNGAFLITTGDPPAQAGLVNAILRAPFGAQTSFAPDRPRNPDLSWEYWDGQSWWQIDGGVIDTTGNLVSSGKITFTVPPSLALSDVVGRNNFWIRARLVGGDYGQEKVTINAVTTNTPTGNTQTQTVTRDPSTIRAPYIVEISVQYKLCDPITPDYVVTWDSGGYRNQTVANTAVNAQVQVFTPLKYALPKTGARRTDVDPQDDCPREEHVRPASPTGGCGCAPGDDKDACDAGAAAPPDDPEAELDRAIYLGFDKPLQGGSIALLFVLDDADHEGAFPLVVEAFAKDVFAPIVTTDGTRGLSQTGIVTLSVPDKLQPITLFGQELQWLRLKPRTAYARPWQPRLRAVYLNGAFADEAETQQQEILGSSDGAQHQSVVIARPPILADSLELRVREPLGEEEIESLKSSDPDSVQDPVGPWPGPWVRWRADVLATAGANERVFELDAETGAVRFGDGQHGAIPPIGQNNVVAVTYRRGGGDLANQVAAWSQMNLITPIAGVEAAIAPAAAAGGAAAQDAKTAARFAPANLRMRERALTLGDIEMLALQSSPDIAQVRALRTATGVRVIQVMRGLNPLPSNEARHELQRYLLQAAPPQLSLPNALTVEGPKLVEGTIALVLTVTDLAFGGTVGADAVAAIRTLLDPTAGGIGGLGWPLGAIPDQAEIAQCLMGIKNLIDVSDAKITAPRPLRPTDLYTVGESGIVVTTRLEEEAAA